MKDSITRVRNVIHGETPDRPPLFDLLRNDAVISHFTGKTLTVENGPEVVPAAYEPAIDATRPSVKLPLHESETVLPDGRQQKIYRWTSWTEHVHYSGPEEYTETKQKQIASQDSGWSAENDQGMDSFLQFVKTSRETLGEIFFFPGIPGPGIMDIFGEVGLEFFSYCLVDCPETIIGLLERNTVQALDWIDHLPADHGIEAGFLGDDIAFSSGPFLSPVWMREHYFPRLQRILTAYHQRGIKVLFHSDGNLNPILDDLVEAGIDGLNPIEVLAGMDVGDIHRRYPHLFMAGGIDVSQLLPFGAPQAVKDAVQKAIEDAEGRIMIGSSTELNNEVPLNNFLAMRDVCLEAVAQV